MTLITQKRLPVVNRPQGYYLRWWYNGWHYWQFLLGDIQFETSGENYRTFGTKSVRLNSGQLTQAQIEALRTVLNTTEVYLYTLYGWMLCKIESGTANVHDSHFGGYQLEFSMNIGSKLPNSTGFSPAIDVPFVPPMPQCEVIIGTQIWLCKNWDAAYPASKVYNDDEANRAVYGGLYTHDQIMSDGFVPDGWHIPTEAEWDTLIDYIGDATDAGGKLKEIGTTHWDSPNTDAIDDYDFTALPAGFFLLGYNELGQTAYFWTTKRSSFLFETGQAIRMKYDSGEITKHQLAKSFYCSVRFIKDDTIISTGLISDLVATAVSDVRIDLSWVNNYVGATNNVIEYSTDGINFSTLATVAASDTTYSVMGLTTTTNYYFRLYFTVSGIISLPSDIANEWTAFNIPLRSNGAGTGVGVLKFQVTGTDVIMTIDGNGLFYDNSLGTINPNTTRTIVKGALRSFYVKVSSGTCKILMFCKNNLKYWGTATTDGFGFSVSLPNMPCTTVQISTLPNSLEQLNVDYGGAITGVLTNIPPNLTFIKIGIASGSFQGDITGDISGIPSNVTKLYIGGNHITGDIANTPATLTELSIGGSNTLYGDIANISNNITYLFIGGSNIVTGDIAMLSSGIIYLAITGLNTLYGSLNDLTTISLTWFQIQGSNTISGTLAGLSSNVGLARLYLYGNNTVSGDVVDLPNSIIYLLILGDNTVNGDTADLPTNLLILYIAGSNTITGDVANLSRDLTMINGGVYTGDAADLPPDLTSIIASGAVTGDLADLPVNTRAFSITGNRISDYTSGHVWSSNMVSLIHLPEASYGLSSSEVDNLLIDLATVTWAGTKTLNIAGNNAARTSASDAAVTSLQAQGVTVITN